MEGVKQKLLGQYFLNLLNLKKNILDSELIIIYLKYLKKNNNIKIIKTIIENKSEIKENTNDKNFIWFKNRNSSCRYDSFLLLYMQK